MAQSPSAVILEPPKIKSDTVSTVCPSISYEVMGPDAMIFIFWMLSFKPTFSLSTFTFIKRLFKSRSIHVTPVEVGTCRVDRIILVWFCATCWTMLMQSFSLFQESCVICHLPWNCGILSCWLESRGEISDSSTFFRTCRTERGENLGKSDKYKYFCAICLIFKL